MLTNRREFMKYAALGALSLAAGGCATRPTPEGYPKNPDLSFDQFAEFYQKGVFENIFAEGLLYNYLMKELPEIGDRAEQGPRFLTSSFGGKRFQIDDFSPEAIKSLGMYAFGEDRNSPYGALLTIPWGNFELQAVATDKHKITDFDEKMSVIDSIKKDIEAREKYVSPLKVVTNPEIGYGFGKIDTAFSKQKVVPLVRGPQGIYSTAIPEIDLIEGPDGKDIETVTWPENTVNGLQFNIGFEKLYQGDIGSNGGGNNGGGNNGGGNTGGGRGNGGGNGNGNAFYQNMQNRGLAHLLFMNEQQIAAANAQMRYDLANPSTLETYLNVAENLAKRIFLRRNT